jgi:hypothetical protein
MIGRRHHENCFCGCQFVEGYPGETVEVYAVVRFLVASAPSGAVREQLVAYSDLDLIDPPTREAGGL